ncbi:MAG: hypothetical protein ACSLE2_12475 [Lysobacterales bacterium]
MNRSTLAIASLALVLRSLVAGADPGVVSTEVIGPFSGHDAALHPANLTPHRIEYYGTDLGWSYEHQGTLHFLFGDTWATEAYAPIESSTGARFDDGFGTIVLAEWPDPDKIDSHNIPPIRLGQHARSGEMSAIDPGHAMDLGHTPMGGFSNGSAEFGIFNITKPHGCRQDADCSDGLSCDAGLGYYGLRFDQEESLTLACVDGMPMCQADTMVDDNGAPLPGSGFCVDRRSTVWTDTPTGRVSASGIRVLIGLRSDSDPRKYPHTRTWLTNKFLNVAARTVERFEPGGTANDYNSARGTGDKSRVLLWGRPGFVGVGANNRPLGLYFAYADMPEGSGFEWAVNYYSGTVNGTPQFSRNQAEAVPLDLDSTQAGIQPGEVHDIVHQMSLTWVESLGSWVMFYGGGIIRLPTPLLPTCGVLELFARFECADVNVGNGAIRMRTAEHPWGPWSPPQDVIVGGNPEVPGSGQYGPGGVLRHPDCVDEGCAAHTQTPFYNEKEYGFLYGTNIIEQWTRSVEGGVDLYWNASTWDPYRVVLLKTRITP